MKPIFIFISLLTLVTSCVTPSAIVKVTPYNCDGMEYWNVGQQFVYAKSNNVVFDCGFNKVENGKLIFNIKVTNESDSVILVDPALFRIGTYNAGAALTGCQYADNPEYVLDYLQMNQNIAEAEVQNAATASLVSSVVVVGAAVAVVASDKDNTTKAQALDAISAGNELTQISTSSIAASADIRAENNWTKRKNLAERFLRKTTLPKGYFIDGEVHFKYDPLAKALDLRLQVGNSQVIFKFLQTQYNSQYYTTPVN